MRITILTDKSSWMNKYDIALKQELEALGHEVDILNSKKDLTNGDIAFFLSCFEIISKKYLDLHKNNIVVHASDLPSGKGWSPTSWQILEGKNEIPLTLFEAVEAVDAGDWYLKDKLLLHGNELIDEWQEKLGKKIIEMCLHYVKNYGKIACTKQEGITSFYPKRTQADSKLDINKSIKEQFNLLRISDNDKYPAFFEFNNKKYILKIYNEEQERKQQIKVSLMQPSFLPWQGLFELILKSDKFVFLDDFQFVTQSHHTRNKLFVNKNQIDYYCVPVQKSKCFELALNNVLIVENNQWKNKLLRKMEYNYQKTPFFNEIFPRIKTIIEKDNKTLSELNIALIKEICKILDIKTEFLYSSNFTKETNSKAIRTKRVFEILDWAESTQYLCAFGSFDYMKEDGYDFEKYPVIFQNYIPKPYKQLHSNDFVPYLSVLDALFNVGSQETLNLIKNGTEKWLKWNERKAYKIQDEQQLPN